MERGKGAAAAGGRKGPHHGDLLMHLSSMSLTPEQLVDMSCRLASAQALRRLATTRTEDFLFTLALTPALSVSAD